MLSFGTVRRAVAPPCLSTRTRSDRHFADLAGACAMGGGVVCSGSVMCGVWCVMCGVWCVVCGVFCGVVYGVGIDVMRCGVVRCGAVCRRRCC